MTMFIRITSVCDALGTTLPRLSREAREAVRALVTATTRESRSLCFVPIRAGCLTELWPHCMYENGHEDVATSAGDAARLSGPAGWVVLPEPDAPASQVRRLGQIVEAFHFFAPLGHHLDELAHVDAQLANTIAALQRIRPTPTAELFGETFALIPPATFAVAAPCVIKIQDTMPPRPQCCPQYRANTALLPQSLFLVLHGPGTKIEVDAMFGRVRPE